MSNIRRDVTTLDSKWWSTSIVGMVTDPPELVAVMQQGSTTSNSNNSNNNSNDGSDDVFMANNNITSSTTNNNNTSTNSNSGNNNSNNNNNNNISPPAMETSDPSIVDATTAANNNNNNNINNNSENHTAASSSISMSHGKYLLQALSSSACQNKTIFNGVSTVSVAEYAQQCLTFMLEWAGHMSIPAVLLPAIPCQKSADNCLPYAQLLCTLAPIAAAQNVQLWITTPLNPEALERFQMIHTLCDAPSNLGCMLIFDASSNSNPTTVAATNNAAILVGQSVSLVHASVGCALRAVAFDTTAFLTNKRGYPTLSKSHQVLFTELLRRVGRTLRVLVQGIPFHHSPQTEAGGQSGCLSYLQYLRHLRQRDDVVDVLDTNSSQLEAAYLDHLQSPLQPLGDNLEFQTYETFETDPIKYSQYKRAIELALRDAISLNQLTKLSSNSTSSNITTSTTTTTNSTTDNNNITNNLNNSTTNNNNNNNNNNNAGTVFGVTILVVGAGRGPLIRAALQAVQAVHLAAAGGISIIPTIVAVEKNPSAILYLHSVQARETSWTNTVTIVECDMRYAARNQILQSMMQDPDKCADICVSELLGSFGDNELSPECLDGVQTSGIIKETCVCIPQSYTSYLAPVSSMRLHCEAQVKAFDAATPTEGPSGKPTGSRQALETPYVVRTHAASQTHKELRCWEFAHFQKNDQQKLVKKGDAKTISNERFAQLHFTPNPTQGAGNGCGYGLYDGAVASMAASGTLTSDMAIHGFLGTFHCVLYQSPLSEKDNSLISIAPQSFSVGMFSWFPLYFPLRQPLYVPHGASIICNMWRKTNMSQEHVGGGGRVWYEWCAQVVAPGGTNNGSSSGGGDTKILNVTPIHNPNGRSYFVRL
eukprot:CAMPEP_0197825410 /NCGR_PEP_ID=MMETSP1437-20131217/2497_1 /TAXON_ID=49252 ORGANISM="Eucampia antarctica, Strain CCMP1452" /NCGR_SAMPLE_ID=MMETSP1437 /ASSEMBLY_ACC=CAM_ASM_001096 /LENGTH=876 /DNA_ID=CAMNT_0043425403 /DNA_START=154 /DNA_END=2784 /DNA_ORIENTATION=-